jgi:hypothetical protein
MPSFLTVRYPEHQLGVWQVRPGDTIPNEASWVVADSPDYGNINLLENPSFERELLGWDAYTPSDKTALHTEIRDGERGKSAVMVSDEMGYRGGLLQVFGRVPPNTTFHFSVKMKTVSVDGLETVPLYVDVYDEEGRWYGTALPRVYGSTDWTIRENEITTPNKTTRVAFFPALVYNKGEVWIDEAYVDMDPSPRTAPAILDWTYLRLNGSGLLPFKTPAQVEKVEELLGTIPTEKFWGIIFIAEEVYRTDIQFNGDVNATWFGEKLLGYPQYLAQNSGATEDEWRDEMYLRTIRGFYDHFSLLTKVGITWGWLNPNDWIEYYGQPAISFIQQHYDFIVLYPYTENLAYWLHSSKPYLSAVEETFVNQKKFWILTRCWDYSMNDWEREAIALEMKNCLDRNIVITSYYYSKPPFEQQWADMLKCVELYNTNQPYYEALTYGENRLTGVVDYTYGCVS